MTKVSELLAQPDNPFLPAIMECQAHSKTTGTKCGNKAIKGGSVCRFHGGAAPQVKAAAARRYEDQLRLLRDTAFERLMENIGTPGRITDPKLMFEIVERGTKLIELIEGRPTERTESREERKESFVRTLELRLTQLLEREQMTLPGSS